MPSVLMGGASKYALIFLAFWHIFSTLSHPFSCFNDFCNQFALFLSIYSPINNHLLTLHYAHYSPNFLKTALSFTLSPLLFYIAKHRPFSPSPPLLFLNLNKIIRICSYNGYYKDRDRDINSALTHFPDSPINFNIKHKSKPFSCSLLY